MDYKKIDALIHEKVFNLENENNLWNIPNYSNNYEDAFKVAEKLKLAIIPQSGNPIRWLACDVEVISYNNEICSTESVPLSICLTALSSIGIDVDEFVEDLNGCKF